MQDYPKLLLQTQQQQQQQQDHHHNHHHQNNPINPPSSNTSLNTTCLVVTFPRFMAWSPVKNDYVRAKLLFERTGFEESPRSGEADIQELHRQQLMSVNACPCCNREGTKKIQIEEGAHICLWPEAGVTTEELHSHIGKNVIIRKGSVVIVRCRNWFLDNVEIDGCCILGGDEMCNEETIQSSLSLHNIKIVNKGWHYEQIDPEDPQVDVVYRMRGYQVCRVEQCEVFIKSMGKFLIENTTWEGSMTIEL